MRVFRLLGHARSVDLRKPGAVVCSQQMKKCPAVAFISLKAWKCATPVAGYEGINATRGVYRGVRCNQEKINERKRTE